MKAAEAEKEGRSLRKTVVISIMPCTAKKAEIKRPEHFTEGQQDVDYVLTTTEVTRMIKEAGMDLSQIEPEALDMPFGLSSGAASDLWSNGWCDRGSSETSGTAAAG